jgi:hypothetical protein
MKRSPIALAGLAVILLAIFCFINLATDKASHITSALLGQRTVTSPDGQFILRHSSEFKLFSVPGDGCSGHGQMVLGKLSEKSPL